MDTVTLVDEQIRDGERLLDRLAQEGVLVRAAGWVKPADEDRWSLYIVTPLVDEQGLIGAYREVHRVLRSLEDVWIKDYKVKLIGEGHLAARDLLDILQRHHSRTPTRSRRSPLGGMPVDEVYVYPPIGTQSCIPVAYVYRHEDRPGSRRWHMTSQVIAPGPNAGSPGLLHVLENTGNQVILIFAVPCDERGDVPADARDEYEELADKTFEKMRPGEELA